MTVQDNEREESSARTSLLVTILSMIFTVVSILLNIFEYILSRQISEHGSVMIFKFTLKSQKIANMSSGEFSQKVMYSNRRKLSHLVSKMLHINKRQIETMIPTQSNDGAIFSFIVVADAIHFGHIGQELNQGVQNETFMAKLQAIYKIKQACNIPSTSVFKWTFGGDKYHKKDVGHITTQLSDHSMTSYRSQWLSKPVSGTISPSRSFSE